MPTRASRRQFGPSRGRRSPTSWARATVASPTTMVAGSKYLLGSVTLSNPGISETIRRTRGVITVYSDQSAAFEYAAASLGMVVVSDVALAAGAASCPGPQTDQNDDGWFVWVPLVIGGAATTAAPAVQFEFDSKAMRRVEEGFSVAIMAEVPTGSNGMVIGFGISLLTSLS